MGGPERNYRVYLLGIDGLIVHRIDLDCDNDEAARIRAKALIADYDIELWDGTRKIETFKVAK